MSARSALILAAVFGLTGVAAGAFGAHALASLPEEELEWWQTAARYQQIHAVALLGLAGLAGPVTRARSFAAVAFGVGMGIFCGTLYAMALGAPRWLGAITPLGGASLIGGWLALLVHGLASPRPTPSSRS